MASHKRPHSNGSDSDSPSKQFPSANTKVARASSSTPAPVYCSLPPTCNRQPTALADTRELEIHYSTHHAHVCQVSGCSAVFPEERFLQLHITENHDVLALMRQEKGEAIFECFTPHCKQVFRTPKGRRLHLIQTHAYPKEYFFAVTNKGIGHLLTKWGNATTMVRQPWKPRVQEGNGETDVEDETELASVPDAAKPLSLAENQGSSSSHSSLATITAPPKNPDTSSSLSDIEASMASLSLVPDAIRFGRGGTNNRAARRSHAPGRGGGRVHPNASNTRGVHMEIDGHDSGLAKRGRGNRGLLRIPAGVRGVRGRGRG